MPTYEGAQLQIMFDTDDHTARGVVTALMNLNSVYETLVYLLQLIESDPENSTVGIPAGVIVAEDKPIAQADLLDLLYVQPGSLILTIGAITLAGVKALQILRELLDPQLREARRAEAAAKAGLAQGAAIARAIKNMKDLEKVQDPAAKTAIRDKILKGIGALPPNSIPPIYLPKPA
jgi:hypothetical protein